MAKEILLWLKEKMQQAFTALKNGIIWLWRWLAGWLKTVSSSTWRKIAVALPLGFIIYILVGMAFVNRVDDSLALNTKAPNGGSQSVAALSYLVEREVKIHNWTANDPFFLPGYYLDNTPNYQRGMMGALSRFAFELRDQLGRSRGSSSVDPDLEAAAGNLAKEPNLWVMDFSTSLLPTTPSDAYYRAAVKQFDTYNQKLASGDAVFERRSDNLLATLDRISLDLGASSAALEQYIGENAGGFLPDTGADDLFYKTKGQVYAYTVLLEALRQDFAPVIQNRELAAIYDELLRSMKSAALLDPLVVTNGATDGTLANHLSIQGFYLLRARTQLKEVTNILLK